MEPNPLVSIMIPTYNQPEYLPHAVQSALEQTYHNLEILIADDASSKPEVASILAIYEANDRIQVYRNTHNLGRVKNYQKTLYERASGEWVINLDGDDSFGDPTFIEQAMKMVCANPRLVMVSGQSMEVTEKTEKLARANAGDTRSFTPEEGYAAFLKGTYFPFHGATLYRRCQALKVGFYQHDIISADLESFLKLMQTGEVGTVDLLGVRHRIHSSNASQTMSVNEFIENTLTFSAPLSIPENVESLVLNSTLKKWTRAYTLHKGKDYAYKILKGLQSNKGFFRYLYKIWGMDKLISLVILFQPKNLLRLLRNVLCL